MCFPDHSSSSTDIRIPATSIALRVIRIIFTNLEGLYVQSTPCQVVGSLQGAALACDSGDSNTGGACEGAGPQSAVRPQEKLLPILSIYERSPSTGVSQLAGNERRSRHWSAGHLRQAR